MPQVPDAAHELFAKCQQKLKWIKKEGFDLDDLQAAADFAGDLVHDAQELREFLAAALERQRQPKS